MLDKEDPLYPSFDIHKTEFDNPSCFTLHMILIELLGLPLFCVNGVQFSSTICTSIINLFFNG